MKLIFATHNPHKLEEISHILGEGIELLSLHDIGCHEDIPEPFHTLKENAIEKTRFIREKFNMDCFADDTGLEIAALNGEPGVFSARYAISENVQMPLQMRFKANIEKVLLNLMDVDDRNARFRTVISLDLNNQQYLFEGIINGTIQHEESGEKGFGYDPIFRPEGFIKSFAEMSLEEKNQISHRAIAFNRLKEFLQTRL
jgi:XTP/dITP diphosphohydrolase